MPLYDPQTEALERYEGALITKKELEKLEKKMSSVNVNVSANEDLSIDGEIGEYLKDIFALMDEQEKVISTLERRLFPILAREDKTPRESDRDRISSPESVLGETLQKLAFRLMDCNLTLQRTVEKVMM